MIVRYSLAEIERMQAEGNTGTNWARTLNMTQDEADAEAEADEDSAYLLTEDFESDNPHKRFTVTVDSEVANFYKKLGADCQSTVNAVLKAYMLVQEHRV